jgi:hypothetical protein
MRSRRTRNDNVHSQACCCCARASSPLILLHVCEINRTEASMFVWSLSCLLMHLIRPARFPTPAWSHHYVPHRTACVSANHDLLESSHRTCRESNVFCLGVSQNTHELPRSLTLFAHAETCLLRIESSVALLRRHNSAVARQTWPRKPRLARHLG